MLEEDYLMKQILEMVRALLKILFHIDLKREEIIEEEDMHLQKGTEEKLRKYISLADKGKMNQAENLLYEELDSQSMNDLKIALLFYEYLSHKSRDFLDEYDYSYEEIKDGIEWVLQQYGYNNLGIF